MILALQYFPFCLQSALTKGDDSLDMIFEDDSSDSEEEPSTTDSVKSEYLFSCIYSCN